MFNIDKKKFGAFVAALRKEKGITQKELSEQLCISDKAVSKWETGGSILTIEPSAKISIPPEGKLLLIELHIIKTKPNIRRAPKTQEADRTRKVFFNSIFFRRSTDNHTPKLYQYNCEAYKQPASPGFS